MRSDAMIHPWSRYIKVMLDGQELKHCKMADEEMGCAEVYHLAEDGKRRLDFKKYGTRMLWGKVELVATDPVAERILAEPGRAQEIWDEYYEAKFGDMNRELVASGYPPNRR